MDTRVLMAIFLTIFTILFIWLLVFTIFYIVNIFNVDLLDAYNTASQNLGANTPLVFAQNNVLTGSAISHIPGSTDIDLNESGIYKISYNVTLDSFPTLVNPKVLNLTLDGVVVPGSETSVTLSALGNRATLSATVFVPVSGSGTIKLVNVTADTRILYANIVVEKVK